MRKGNIKSFIILSILFIICTSLYGSQSTFAEVTPVNSYVLNQYELYKNDFIDEKVEVNEIEGVTVEKHKVSLPSKNLHTFYWYAKSSKKDEVIFDIHGGWTTDLDFLPISYAKRGYSYVGFVWWDFVKSQGLEMYPDNINNDALVNAAIFAMYVKDALELKESALASDGYPVIGNSYGGVIGSIIAESDLDVNKLLLYTSAGGFSSSIGKTVLFDANTTNAKNIARIDPKNTLTRDIPVYSYFATNDAFFSIETSKNYFWDRKNTVVYYLPNKNHDISGFSQNYADVFLKNITKLNKSYPYIYFGKESPNKNSIDRKRFSVIWNGVTLENVYYSNGNTLDTSYWFTAEGEGNGIFAVYKRDNLPLNIILEGTDNATGLKVSHVFKNAQ